MVWQASAAIGSAVLRFFLEAYVGFTSGTGSAFGNHDVISWEYRSEFDPIPEPSTFVLAGLGGLALLVARRWRKSAAA